MLHAQSLQNIDDVTAAKLVSCPIVSDLVLATGRFDKYIFARLDELILLLSGKYERGHFLLDVGVDIMQDRGDLPNRSFTYQKYKVMLSASSGRRFKDGAFYLDYFGVDLNGRRISVQGVAGIAYNTSITRRVFETRWVFQEVDGMDNETAFNLSSSV